jgi:ribosomal protein S18 acetylase RimI-like enzyme
MRIVIQPMSMTAFEEVLTLWQNSAGVGLSNTDSPANIARFLERNPGLSFIARDGEQLVGAALCGHDGRRGYIHHLAVLQSHRRQGIGQTLVDHCLAALRSIDIDKCHLFVFNENQEAIAFWERTGWIRRSELAVMSRFVTAVP